MNINKNIAAAAVILTASAMQAPCWAEDAGTGVYVTVGGGKAYSHGKANVLSANEDYYVKSKLKDSNALKVAAGKEFGEFRAEFEFLNFSKAKLNLLEAPGIFASLPNSAFRHNAKLSSNAYFINAYYDFKELNEFVQPYVGWGLGLAHHKLSAFTILQTDTSSPSNPAQSFGSRPKKTKNSFAWNLSVGTKVKVNQNLFFDLSYKFTDLGKFKGSTQFINSAGTTLITLPNVKKKIRHHVIMAGVGIRF